MSKLLKYNVDDCGYNRGALGMIRLGSHLDYKHVCRNNSGF